MSHGLTELERLLGQFHEVLEIPLDQAIIDSSVALMCECQIASYDAVHAATALDIGVSHVVTADADFLRIQDPRLIITVL